MYNTKWSPRPFVYGNEENIWYSLVFRRWWWWWISHRSTSHIPRWKLIKNTSNQTICRGGRAICTICAIFTNSTSPKAICIMSFGRARARARARHRARTRLWWWWWRVGCVIAIGWQWFFWDGGGRRYVLYEIHHKVSLNDLSKSSRIIEKKSISSTINFKHCG